MRKVVLVVDDEDTVALTIAMILNRSDHEFLAIHTSKLKDAFAMASAIKADLVLLDVLMPDANGLEHAIKFRDQLRLRVLLMSAWPGAADLLRELGLNGAECFPIVAKPIAPDELKSRIRECLVSKP